MHLVTPLNKVLGLGSAKDGPEHWWAQRLTAVGLVPLGLWFAWSLATLEDFGYATLVAWMARPVTSILMLLSFVTLSYHSHLGVQVVIEDYVNGKSAKVVSLVLSSFAHVAVVTAGVFAILRIAFGSS